MKTGVPGLFVADADFMRRNPRAAARLTDAGCAGRLTDACERAVTVVVAEGGVPDAVTPPWRLFGLCRDCAARMGVA